MMSRMINAHTRLNKALDLHPQVLDYSVSLDLPHTRGLGVKRTTVHSLVKSLGITRSGKGETRHLTTPRQASYPVG
jgi:hypothetical protein